MGKRSSETPGQQVVFDSLSRTYPVEPFVRHSFGIILMLDRGCQLTEVLTFLEGESIIREFQKVIQASGNQNIRVLRISFLKGTMFTMEMRTIGTLLPRI
eukprot:scaffold2836_cov99-Cylindrotheca_fusiformis.AAC.12